MLIFINIVIGLIITPFIVKNLGKTEYGLYMLVGSLISYFALFDFGINNSILKFVAKYRHEKNERDESVFISSTIFLYTLISLMILMFAILIYLNLDVIFINSLTELELVKFRQMYVFATINILWIIIGGAFMAIINAYDLFLIPKLVNIVRVILRSFSIYLLLSKGNGAIAIIILDTAFNFIVFLYYYIYVKFKLNLKFSYKNIQLTVFKIVFNHSSWIFLGVIMDQLYWRSGQLILGIQTNTEKVAIYSIATVFISYFMTFSTAISGFFLPTATRMFLDKVSENDLLKLMIKIGRLQWYMISVFLLGFIFFGQDFILLWVGNGYQDAWLIVLFVIIPLSIPSVQNVSNSILEAYNYHSTKIRVNIIVALFFVSLSFFLAPNYGVYGVCIPISLSIILGQIFYNNFYITKMLKIDIIYFFKKVFMVNYKVFLINIIFIFLIKHLFRGVLDWYSLSTQVILFLSFFGITNYYFAFNQYEKHLFRKFLNK